jgi:hypothetical protein
VERARCIGKVGEVVSVVGEECRLEKLANAKEMRARNASIGSILEIARLNCMALGLTIWQTRRGKGKEEARVSSMFKSCYTRETMTISARVSLSWTVMYSDRVIS